MLQYNGNNEYTAYLGNRKLEISTEEINELLRLLSQDEEFYPIVCEISEDMHNDFSIHWE